MTKTETPKRRATRSSAKEPVPATKAATKAAPKAAPSARAKTVAAKAAAVPPEQRRHYIEMAAYYIAERRGFAPGNPQDDWAQAESEIDRLLAQGRLGSP